MRFFVFLYLTAVLSGCTGCSDDASGFDLGEVADVTPDGGGADSADSLRDEDASGDRGDQGPSVDDASICPPDRENCYCFDLSIEDCAADEQCRVRSGWPLNEEEQCWETQEVAGCVPQGNCEQNTTLGLDAMNRCWMFSSMCVPTHGFDFSDKAESHCSIQADELCE